MPAVIHARTAADQIAAQERRRNQPDVAPTAGTVLVEIAAAIEAGTVTRLHAQWLRNIAAQHAWGRYDRRTPR